MLSAEYSCYSIDQEKGMEKQSEISNWRLRVVHLIAKAVGVQFKFETLPFGARCHFRASAEGVDYLRSKAVGN